MYALFFRSDYDSLQDVESQVIPSRESGVESIHTASSPGIFPEVDRLIEGSDTDKEKAHDILQRNRSKVGGVDIESFICKF